VKYALSKCLPSKIRIISETEKKMAEIFKNTCQIR
jgi:hypothetical protein